MPTNSSRPPLLLFRFLALALVLSMAAAACSSGTNTIEAAGGSQFCSVLANFPDEDSGVSPNEAADALGALTAALPPTAPSSIRESLTAIAEITAITASTDGEMTDSDIARLSAGMDTLDRLDPNFFNGWLTATCPQVVAAASTGGGLLGGLTEGSSQATRVDAANAPEPRATATPEPTPEPTPIPVVTTILGEDGHVGRFRARQLAIKQVAITNGTNETFFGTENEAADIQRVMVTMFTQTEDFPGTMETDGFRIENADGRSISADQLFDLNGSPMWEIRLEERDSADFVVSFELPEPVDSVDGWTMYYGSEFINEPLPLIGTVEANYPIELDTTGQPVPFIASVSGFGRCDDAWSIAVLHAIVDVEGEAFNLERNVANRRFLNVEVEIANEPDVIVDECRPTGDASAWGYGWRVLADDVAQGYEATSYPSGLMGEGTRVQFNLRFDFPADTRSLVLVDEMENEIASWDVTIPPVPGEEGYSPG